MTHRRGDEGVAALMVALCLLVLMGFAALAVDAGMGYNDRRGAQNASDSAALAAAWEACNPTNAATPAPTAVARATAAENGYDHSDPHTDVQVVDQGSGRWQVEIRVSNDTQFGAATPFAADSLTVAASATAQCEEIPFLGGYAIFAGGTNCSGGVELDLSGASKIINGGLHSNGSIKVTGAEAEVNGDVTYIDESQHEPSTKLHTPLAYPLELTIDEYRPGGTRAVLYDDPDPAADQYFDTPNVIDNAWMESQGYATSLGGSKIEINRPGVYYAGDSIDLHQVSMASGVKATFVSEGQIKVTGESAFSAFDPIVSGGSDPGVLFFSDYEAPPTGPTCTGTAIDVSTSGVTWTGAIFAPHGAVTASFATATSLNGSIFAYTVNLSGSDFEISWADNPAAAPDFAVDLLE